MTCNTKNQAAYEAFIAAIDDTVAGRDENGSTLSFRVAVSAEGNAADTVVEDPTADYWEIALFTAQFMLDDWRNNYPELLKPDDTQGGDTTMNCDQCEMVSINGVACHEHGCPNNLSRWDDGEWIKQRECRECGSLVDRDDPCCAYDEVE